MTETLSNRSGGRDVLLTVLVVEDEWLVRDMVARELSEVGYHVLQSETADEAIQLLAGQHVDLLLTDIRLPGILDGWALAEQARKRTPQLHVIYATAYSSEKPRPVANSTIIQKPYRLPDIVAAVGKRLRA
jgi:CheY-like chemotaxis protein